MKSYVLAMETQNGGYFYPLLGKTVIQYVIDAVHSAGINDITVVCDSTGQELLSQIYPTLQFSYENTKTEGALVVWGDTPLLTGPILQEFIASNERDLTDMPEIAHGLVVFQRVQDYVALAETTAHMRTAINHAHMLRGVRMIDPASVYIDSTVIIGEEATIYPSVILEGECKIANKAHLGAGCHLINTEVGERAEVLQSVLKNSKVGAGTTVGPFAYLRDNAVVGNNCRIGNFVEIKKSVIGDGTKAAHHAYIGDANVGKNVNYSCGAITANYDGKNKHCTTIGNNAFIGSNVSLVAPITVGEGAFVAAGSTIISDLQEDSLGIARAYQVEKLGWAKNKKK